ncbi:MAG: MmcQ/YjbR family DNA-binding protein [Bacteroidota bacterium]
MNIEELREFCIGLPAVTEDIKWEEHLVFSVAGKIFCLTGLEPPLQVALKVPEEQFDELTQSGNIIQASHFARRQWMTVVDESNFNRAEWEHYIVQSYNLVKSKLPRKAREQIDREASGTRDDPANLTGK